MACPMFLLDFPMWLCYSASLFHTISFLILSNEHYNYPQIFKNSYNLALALHLFLVAKFPLKNDQNSRLKALVFYTFFCLLHMVIYFFEFVDRDKLTTTNLMCIHYGVLFPCALYYSSDYLAEKLVHRKYGKSGGSGLKCEEVSKPKAS